VIGALVVVAVAAVSVSAILFQGRDRGERRPSSAIAAVGGRSAASSTPSTTSTTTTSTTSTTTTTSTMPAPTAPPTSVEVVPPPPGPAPACGGAASGAIDAMNGDRSGSGLGALCSSSALAGYAQSWAEWMAQHQSLTHQDLGNVLAGTSFSTVAENILSGPGNMSAAQMEAAWMASPPHRQNILDERYTAAGVGIAFSADGRVWVAVDFGG
jgi:uncharacterized protein YkwD